MKSFALKPGDILAAVIILLLAFMLLVFLFKGGGETAVIISGGREIARLPLSKDSVNRVSGGGYTLEITVSGGRVCVSDTDCPDKLCQKAGWLSRAGSSAVCLPGGIILKIEGGSEIDAVVK